MIAFVSFRFHQTNSASNVIVRATTLFFTSLYLFLLLFSCPSYHRRIKSFALSPTNSVIIALLFSSFIRPGTFLLARNIHVVNRIIARVKLSHIAFYDIIYVIALNVVYEIVNVDIHNFAFVAMHR